MDAREDITYAVEAGQSWQECLQDFPRSPGVYLMKDHKKGLIYVGKAKNLYQRVSSYFRGQGHTLKTRKLVHRVRAVSFILVRTEVEALLLERTLIRSHHPLFNVLLRDDKNYPYVRADLQSLWPRLTVVRQRANDGATYLGPFSCTRSLYHVMDVVHRIFPLVRCSPYEFEHCRRPCTYYEIKQCLAPCHKEVDGQAYHDLVQDALDFLRGKNQKVKKSLQQKMQQASEDQNYPLAASYRDQLEALNRISSEQESSFSHLCEADVMSWVGEQDTLCMHVLEVRDYMIRSSRSYILKNPLLETIEDLIPSFLLQYYEHRYPPSPILLSHRPSQMALFQQALKSHWRQKGQPVGGFKIRLCRYQDEKKAMTVSKKNALFAFANHRKIHLTSEDYLRQVEESLPVPVSLQRVECMDISHLSGTARVGSCVVFVVGKPEKSCYRRYKIPPLESDQKHRHGRLQGKGQDEKQGQGEESALEDDYAAIRYVVRRRLQRMLMSTEDRCQGSGAVGTSSSASNTSPPTALLIDGGKGQLNCAVRVRDEVLGDKTLPILALAKEKNEKRRVSPSPLTDPSEKLYIYDEEGSMQMLRLVKGSPAYRFFTQLRDEAHSYGVRYHRQRRSRERHSSLLETIPGIGPSLRTRLLQRFVSYKGLLAASCEELQQVSGISRHRAEDIQAFLRYYQENEEVKEGAKP